MAWPVPAAIAWRGRCLLPIELGMVAPDPLRWTVRVGTPADPTPLPVESRPLRERKKVSLIWYSEGSRGWGTFRRSTSCPR